MNILIFAAGLGTRLKPLTDTMPKALVPIQGTPLLGLLIQKIRNSMSSQLQDIHIVINIHHFADQIIDYVNANHSFGLDIRFSDERDQLLETGGGLRKAIPLFPDDSPILIHNVDILSNVNLPQFYASFPADAAAQMIVSQRDTSRYLLFSDTSRLVGWTNVTTGEVKGPSPITSSSALNHYAFSGIQIVNPAILRPYLDQWQGKFSIIDFYLSICDKVDIRCDLRTDLQMTDVGKPDTLDQLRQCSIISHYFPEITEAQRNQFAMLDDLYADWNQKINVISRKDIDNLYEHHVLHSLAIGKVFQFAPGSSIMDLGCGGGFPGIPLAILFPQSQFHLVDSIGKKIRVAQAIADAVGLRNVRTTHSRGEDISGHYDAVVTRAVMPMADLVKCVARKTDSIIALKGGELDAELSGIRNHYKIWNISDHYSEEYFQTKKIIQVLC